MRQERISAVPGQAAQPASSLQGALQALFPEEGVPSADFSQDLARLLADLTGAKSVVLLANGADGPVIAESGASWNEATIRKIAERASETRAVSSEASWLVAHLRTSEEETAIAVLDLSGANRLALALGTERLELIRALCNAAAQSLKFRLTPQVLRQAQQVQSDNWEIAQALVDALSKQIKRHDLALASLSDNRVENIWYSGQADVSHRSSLRQTDSDRIEAARSSPGSDPTICFLGSPSQAALFSTGHSPLPRDVATIMQTVFAAPKKHRELGSLARKAAVTLTFCATIAAILMIPVQDSIDLPARIEATDQRSLTVPFDGRVDTIEVKDGDQVVAGQTVLASMDTRDITRDLTDLRTQMAAAISKRDSARGQRDAATLREAELNIDLLTVRIAASEEALASATLVAPIDGTIQLASGPDKTGSFIGLGTPLMTVADPDRLAVFMDFNARARATIGDAVDGSFRPDAQPTLAVPFQLTGVSLLPSDPKTDVYLGSSAPIDAQQTTSLVPGMKGVASFDLSEKRLWKLVFDRLHHWARVNFWF